MHFVWSTWNRREWLTPDVAEPVYRCIVAECRTVRAEVVALNGTVDHVHLLVRIPSTVTIANLAQRAKGASSHLVNQVIGREGFQLAGRLLSHERLTLGRGEDDRVH